MAILSDWELWACANEYVRQHGFNAPIFAAMRADELEARCDLDGARNWRLIVDRIAHLLARRVQRECIDGLEGETSSRHRAHPRA